jgi:ankyrin repeat protein
VRALLAAGAWVNVQSAGGYTPTMLAAAAGSVDTLTALIEAKADLSLRNRRGDSADMIAESRQHPAAFSVLDNALFDSWRATLRAGGDLERHPWTARHSLPQGLAHP